MTEIQIWHKNGGNAGYAYSTYGWSQIKRRMVESANLGIIYKSVPLRLVERDISLDLKTREHMESLSFQGVSGYMAWNFKTNEWVFILEDEEVNVKTHLDLYPDKG